MLAYRRAGYRLARATNRDDKPICSRFQLFSDAGLDAYYVPFHYLNHMARVILLGLTPGWTQMERAFWAAKNGLAEGMDGEPLFSFIERTGSFSGPMRRNLVSMLDGIGLNNCLGIDSCDGLFGDQNDLVHFTSAVSAPSSRMARTIGVSVPRFLMCQNSNPLLLSIWRTNSGHYRTPSSFRLEKSPTR